MVPQCGKCGLDKTCKSPKMPVSGAGKRKILIIAEAPGSNEDDKGIQLVGEAGNHANRIFHKVGINMRKDCWLTNALICRPWGYSEDGNVVNRTPTKEEVAYCQPNLMNTLTRYKPDIIIPMGEMALRSLIPLVWKEGEVESVGTWVGWQIPCVKMNCWICPTYHPSAIMYDKTPVTELLITKHLRAVDKLTGKPYPDGVPDYRSMVEMIYDPEKAAVAIEELMREAILPGVFGDKSKITPLAFDYETNMLKPYHSKARILCCSMSNGEYAIAYPMIGKALEMTKQFLRSDIPKIAANLPFEDQWSRKILKTIVRNWRWDTLVGAHWNDCRHGIVSVKFQSFVLLGADDYSYIIDPDKGSRGGSTENRMSKVEISDLLLYCGLDSLFEWQIAERQMKGYLK